MNIYPRAIGLLLAILITFWTVGWVVRNIRFLAIATVILVVTGLAIWWVARAGYPEIAVLVPTGITLLLIVIGAIAALVRAAQRSLDEEYGHAARANAEERM